MQHAYDGTGERPQKVTARLLSGEVAADLSSRLNNVFAKWESDLCGNPPCPTALEQLRKDIQEEYRIYMRECFRFLKKYNRQALSRLSNPARCARTVLIIHYHTKDGVVIIEPPGGKPPGRNVQIAHLGDDATLPALA
ncbi:MAG TPA: hypothetical protein VD995_03270 [Azospirillum sp.]|nr:hypothetical protein [Azospirillum sp.]